MRFSALAGAHRLPQLRAFGLGDVLNFQFVFAARAGLELDLDHAEQPGDQRLLQTHVLNALVRHGSSGAVEQALLDADVTVSDLIAEAAPRHPAEQERETHPQADDRHHVQGGPLGGRTEESSGHGQEQVPQVHHRADQEAEKVRPPPLAWGRPSEFAHTVSRFTRVRISSRIAIASSWPRPGSDTDELWLPAVCSTNVLRP